MKTEELYPCVGICLPDQDEAYCIGCGRPWGSPVVPSAPVPDSAVPPAPTLQNDEPPQPA
ncbi:MAG: DUF1289 domain-containing protein [Rhodocyclaceae bacterium]